MNGNEPNFNRTGRAARSYFFDVRRSRHGDSYLTISERKLVGSGFESYRLVIFEEHIGDFTVLFHEALAKLYGSKAAYKPVEKAYSVREIRETYEHAYLPWTEEDDRLLEVLFCEGLKVEVIAQVFRRNEGAITSRIGKLGLEEKYPKNEE
jgi:hypothetical protein